MRVAVYVVITERATVIAEANSVEAGVAAVREAATDGFLRLAKPSRRVVAFATGLMPDAPAAGASA